MTELVEDGAALLLGGEILLEVDEVGRAGLNQQADRRGVRERVWDQVQRAAPRGLQAPTERLHLERWIHVQLPQ